MARDIEEFLRRAAERRKEQLQQRKQPPAQRPQQRLEEVISEVEIVDEGPRPTRPTREQGVAEHVRSYINTSDISDHAEHLGERIQNVDERVAGRLEKKFDREVARLDDGNSVTDQSHSVADRQQAFPVSQDLIQMLSSPQSLRQAILVSEILRRPHFDD